MYPGSTPSKWVVSSRKIHPKYSIEGYSYSGSALEPVINFSAGGAGNQFFSVRGARSDEYGVSSSDE
jgi:hypothetical protein